MCVTDAAFVGLAFHNPLTPDEFAVDNILQEYGAEIGLSAEEGLPMPSSQSSELEKEIEELRKSQE